MVVPPPPLPPFQPPSALLSPPAGALADRLVSALYCFVLGLLLCYIFLQCRRDIAGLERLGDKEAMWLARLCLIGIFLGSALAMVGGLGVVSSIWVMASAPK
jgi:hypothetical protein